MAHDGRLAGEAEVTLDLARRRRQVVLLLELADILEDLFLRSVSMAFE
ncbi:MAG: hypothetical protein WDM96_15995 [Lacunisphaera sp.]